MAFPPQGDIGFFCRTNFGSFYVALKTLDLEPLLLFETKPAVGDTWTGGRGNREIWYAAKYKPDEPEKAKTCSFLSFI